MMDIGDPFGFLKKRKFKEQHAVSKKRAPNLLVSPTSPTQINLHTNNSPKKIVYDEVKLALSDVFNKMLKDHKKKSIRRSTPTISPTDTFDQTIRATNDFDPTVTSSCTPDKVIRTYTPDNVTNSPTVDKFPNACTVDEILSADKAAAANDCDNDTISESHTFKSIDPAPLTQTPSSELPIIVTPCVRDSSPPKHITTTTTSSVIEATLVEVPTPTHTPLPTHDDCDDESTTHDPNDNPHFSKSSSHSTSDDVYKVKHIIKRLERQINHPYKVVRRPKRIKLLNAINKVAGFMKKPMLGLCSTAGLVYLTQSYSDVLSIVSSKSTMFIASVLFSTLNSITET
ncbi:hypothetical protein OrNV_gp021 [Oryctes rhinoceros nudivirus]|uniref:Uncharacterized protein n=1 Tax=Oryctes rhinoceros nudivirus TaxID=92521 RepID=A0A6B9QQT9_9VIRU|nr:hypothetical protein OrNV_gp021 [Oryctes rhinoceros nudivirus]ACH96151.1 unknown [Oryctes rhinoceros nudivirus]QHG11260.1 hypothetical protein SI_OrNV_gp021 [Oryctes rhinoceros nudivirus]QKE59495.1 hypothetical protein SI_OrNV_gp021 [Oryctes rhinoceros nudivirus]UBO76442.1 hypothetical protein SI_OrNV_gp021 [Oryctes rhinoceros nudivirus]UBR58203.1 hypothetical protein [Oryctes rhinoceros nudivirus]